MNAAAKCQACGHAARDGDPIVTARVDLGPGWPATADIHKSHTADPRSGFHGAEQVR